MILNQKHSLEFLDSIKDEIKQYFSESGLKYERLLEMAFGVAGIDHSVVIVPEGMKEAGEIVLNIYGSPGRHIFEETSLTTKYLR